MTMTVNGSLRHLNEKAYDLCQAFEQHTATRLLPAEYREAIEALLEACQDVHIDHDAVLDVGADGGGHPGGVDMPANDLRAGDVYIDPPGDPVYVTEVNHHGGSVLVAGYIGTDPTEATLDRVTMLIVWRYDHDQED